MPELPEVEEVRRGLEPFLLGKRVEGVRVVRKDFVVVRSGVGLEGLVGRRFVRTWRHGKKLFLVAEGAAGDDRVTTEDGQTVLLHLGMSGRVDCVAAGEEVRKHTHVVLELEGGVEVRFCDPRRFGGIWYFATFAEAREREIVGMGPDGLELVAGDFLAMWKGAKGRLKQRLLSQKDVAGLGNIYVDEAAWEARLHPLQIVSRISAREIGVLVAAIGRVLRESIASGGTTLRDYRNVSDQKGEFARKLKAYGRAGKGCLRCGGKLRSAVVAGRTTVFCPVCQKRK